MEADAVDYAANMKRLIRSGNRRRQMTSLQCSYIYFIQAESGPIKIGRALKPKVRLGELQTANHEDLKLIATVPGDAWAEAEYHRQFGEWRLRGEWFEPASPILAEIARLSGDM